MTAIEVFKEITTEPKWYVGFTSPQNASNIKKRFEEQELSFKTLEEMFNHFGYYLTASWDKNKICDHIFETCDELGNKITTGNIQSVFPICSKCGYRPYIKRDI